MKETKKEKLLRAIKNGIIVDDLSLNHFQILDGLETINETLIKLVDKPEIVIPELPQFPEINIPEPKDVIFPDIQKVEVTNFPEQKAPIVNVPAPIVNIPETKTPIVDITLNQDKTEKLLGEIKDVLNKEPEIEEKPTIDNPLPVELVFNKKTYQAIGGGGYGIAMKETNTKLDTINTTLGTLTTNTLKDYILQEPDDYTTTNVTYLGKMKTNGTWLITKIDSTGNFDTFRYANVSNNPTLTTYALAWAGRVAATYGYLNTLTI